MNNEENTNNKNKSDNMKGINPQALNVLLGVASKKLGMTSDELKNQLESGSFDKALNSVPPKQAEMLKQSLSDKSKAEKILSSPQAKALFQKLNGGK